MAAFRQIILALILLLTIVGCQKQDTKSNVVLWTAFEGIELETLRTRVDAFQSESGFKVTVLKVPFNSLQRKVLIAGPAMQGPDLLIAPHNWIGLLETAELLAPIPTDIISAEDENFYPISRRAVTYGDSLYSAPIMMDCVVLARNTELCPNKPESLDQLVSLAKDCQKNHPDTLGFAYELDEVYFSWAFLAGYGADFFQPFNQKDLNVDAIDFASPGAIDGAKWVADLGLEHGLVPSGLDNPTAVDMFLNDRLGMMLCGPWNLGAIRKAKVPYELEPLPPGPKGKSAPLVGVMGAMLNRHSTDKPGVRELLSFLCSAETSAQLCQSSGRAPARVKSTALLAERVTDPLIQRDLALFSEATQGGIPMPNHPAVSAVWDPMKQALELITTGQTQADEELTRTTERVRSKIRFMME